MRILKKVNLASKKTKKYQIIYVVKIKKNLFNPKDHFKGQHKGHHFSRYPIAIHTESIKYRYLVVAIEKIYEVEMY